VSEMREMREMREGCEVREMREVWLCEHSDGVSRSQPLSLMTSN
jgi:hypothetical protein